MSTTYLNIEKSIKNLKSMSVDYIHVLYIILSYQI